MPDSLSSLVADLIRIKSAEEEWKRDRIRLEEQIAALIPGPDKGQKTATLDDGTKVTVKRDLNYKADCDGIRKMFQQDGYETLPLPIEVKTTFKLDEKGYEWYRNNLPDAFTQIADYVTVTPAKVAVTVKEKE